MPTQDSYDRLAADYTTRIAGELVHKPFDRDRLDDFARRVRDLGPVCDLGCGPGHVARYLKDRGVDVLGVDLSTEMVAQARRLNPDLPFQPGDMRALAVPDGAWGGIAAFYSLIHIPRDDAVTVLGELRRVLRPGGWLLAAFHVGDHVLHLDDLWGHPVDVDFVFFTADEMAGYLAAAGFDLIERRERDPYPPEVEAQTRRAYLLARKPPGTRPSLAASPGANPRAE
jgi:SAM-dependent methyltransferase